MLLHATLIARRCGGAWRGVLLEGPSGAGKSDLALRALGQGWKLAADDRVIVWTSGGRLFGRAHPRLSGLIEARGLGVRPVPALPFTEILLAVACAAADADLERVPDPERRLLLGRSVPLVRMNAQEGSALAKLGLALAALAL